MVRTKASEPLAERMAKIHDGIAGVIGEHRPDVVVVEELYSTYTHPRTAILMGHARGVIYLAAGTSGVPVESYTATRVKKSLTGNGTASKQQVQRMVCQLLGLPKAPKSADVTDALALAICHAGPRRMGTSGGRRRRADAAPAVVAALAREAQR